MIVQGSAGYSHSRVFPLAVKTTTANHITVIRSSSYLHFISKDFLVTEPLDTLQCMRIKNWCCTEVALPEKNEKIFTTPKMIPFGRPELGEAHGAGSKLGVQAQVLVLLLLLSLVPLRSCASKTPRSRYPCQIPRSPASTYRTRSWTHDERF